MVHGASTRGRGRYALTWPVAIAILMRIASGLILLAVAAQAFLAGYGLFNRMADAEVLGYFGPHVKLGHFIIRCTPVLFALTVIAAVLTRQGWRRVIAAALLVLAAYSQFHLVPLLGGRGW